MSEKITRDGDIITIKSEVTKVIDLAPLKAELAELEAIEEPSDEEILELAKQGMVHYFYDPARYDRMLQIEMDLNRYARDI